MERKKERGKKSENYEYFTYSVFGIEDLDAREV